MVSQRFRTILKGIENNHTKLKTAEDHEAVERFYRPKIRGQPEPLDIPTEHNCKKKYN